MARYGNQSVPDMLRSITVNDMIRFRDALQEFLDEERKQGNPEGDF